jgi:hypothetical protein
LLAKLGDGAYVRLSHLGRFRVIDPTLTPRGDWAPGTNGKDGRAGATSALSAAFPAPRVGRLRPKSADVRRRSVAGGRDPGEPQAL